MLHPILHNFSLQAGGSHYPSINPQMQQAFAMMIIKECIKLAEQEEDRFLEMSEVDLAYAMQNFQELLKDHFGIKNEHTTNS